MERLPETEPVTPTGQYLNSSVLSICILAVLESEVPLNTFPYVTLIRDVFLPIHPRFSCIMVADNNGVKKWKRVEVNLKDHIKVPSFPKGMTLEFYDQHLEDYLTDMALDQLPQSQPLWEIHIIQYPTSSAAGCLIFKLHHALGDGYSLMGALLSCFQRADDPSLPLTFPSKLSSLKKEGRKESVFKHARGLFSCAVNTVLDFGWSVAKSSFLEDDRTPIRSGEDGVQFRPTTVTTLTFSLDHIKQIKNKLDVTINDVITGVIFLGTRLYMQSTNHELCNKGATSLVLLNTRAIGGYNYKHVNEMVKPNTDMPWGNRFAFLHLPIPKLTHCNSCNPLSFVVKTHESIKLKRNSASTYLMGMLLDALRKFCGAEATAKYIYNTVKNSSIVITNVVGPLEKMALANHPMKGIYVAVVGGPESISIALVSYAGKLRVAISTEKGFVDSQKFCSCIERAFEMILKATD